MQFPALLVHDHEELAYLIKDGKLHERSYLSFSTKPQTSKYYICNTHTHTHTALTMRIRRI